MRGIQKLRAFYFLYPTQDTQEQMYCHFLASQSFSLHLLLQSMSFLMPYDVFSCVQSHISTLSLTSPSFTNWCPCNTSWSIPKIWLWDGVRFGPYAGWGRILNLFLNYSCGHLTYEVSIVMMKKNSICQHYSMFTANSRFQLLFKHGTILCWPPVHTPVSAQEWAQNSVNITLPAEGTLEFPGPECWHVFALRALTFGCRFIVVHPCFISCDSLFEESLSSSTALLQKFYSCFQVYSFLLICKLLWYPSCTNFVIPEVLVDDGICRSTADVILVGYISDSNLSILSNQSINSFSY
jgi:hypothetical protein